jgi:hypothetical protein
VQGAGSREQGAGGKGFSLCLFFLTEFGFIQQGLLTSYLQNVFP